MSATVPPPLPPAAPPVEEPTTSPGRFGQFFARAATVAGLTVVTATVVLTATAAVGIGSVVGLFAALAVPLPLTHVAGDERASDTIAVITIDGPIVNGPSIPGWLGSPVTGADDVIEQLDRAATDDDTVAVVLEVSTPGGTIPGSMDIADAVAAFRTTGKPVVAYVSDLSASGGVWATATADKVIGHPGALTGSVGVLYGPFYRYDRVTSLGGSLLEGGVSADEIDAFYVTAGDRKDAGDPFRGLTDDEQQRIQRIVDLTYDDFTTQVADHRSVTSAQLRDDLGADLFAAADALDVGLLDDIGRFDDAWQVAADLAGVDQVSVVALQRPVGLFASLAETATPPATDSYQALCATDTARAYAYHGDLAAYCAALR